MITVIISTICGNIILNNSRFRRIVGVITCGTATETVTHCIQEDLVQFFKKDHVNLNDLRLSLC